MSTEEDVQLRDLIIKKALVPNGCLAKIRAQLRASIFLSLSEDEKLQRKEPLQNKKVKEQLQSTEGKLLFSIIREFLEFYDLHFTITVYEPESYGDCAYKYDGREKLIEDLGVPDVDPAENSPVLEQLLKIIRESSKSNGKVHQTKSPPELNDTYEKSATDEIKTDSIADELDNTSTSDNSLRVSSEGLKCITEIKTKPKENKLNVTFNISPILKTDQKSEEQNKKSKSSLASLADLPPLQLNKSRNNDTMLLPSLYKKEKSNLKDLDKLLDADLDSLDNYEEDIMTSPSMHSPILMSDTTKINVLTDSISTKLNSNKDGSFLDKISLNDGIIKHSFVTAAATSLDRVENSVNKNDSLMDLHSSNNSTVTSEDFELNSMANVEDIMNSSASN